MASKSASDRLIVVKHKPGIKLKRRLVFITGVVVVGAVCFILGGYHMRYQHEKVLDQLQKLSQEFIVVQQSETALRQQVFNLESGRTIDDVAVKGINDTINEYKETIEQLKKDVSFYQSIMTPSENDKGLLLKTIELKPIDETRYAYKLVLAQVVDNKSYISGKVDINVLGSVKDQTDIVSLAEIAKDQSTTGIKFKFKYFQELTGEIALTEGFSPQSILVVAEADGKKASKLEISNVWNDLVR